MHENKVGMIISFYFFGGGGIFIKIFFQYPKKQVRKSCHSIFFSSFLLLYLVFLVSSPRFWFLFSFSSYPHLPQSFLHVHNASNQPTWNMQQRIGNEIRTGEEYLPFRSPPVLLFSFLFLLFNECIMEASSDFLKVCVNLGYCLWC